MAIIAAQLRKNYATKNIDELIELRARNQLTDLASEILDEELRSRGVSESAVAFEQSSQKMLEKEQIEQASNLAPLSRRLIAKLLDVWGSLLILGILNFLLFLVTPKVLSDIVADISIVVWFGYLLFKDGLNGQSIGKRILGIKVIESASGEPCSLPRSCIRNGVAFLGIFDLAFLLGAERKRLGDIAAGTYVVNKAVRRTP